MKSFTNLQEKCFKKSIFIVILTACLLALAPQAHSRPAFTKEELAKARKAASEAKHPIDFDAVMDEADRLGIECEGDLTTWGWIEICRTKVSAAQARERTAASKKRVVESRKRQEAMRNETIRLINEAADKAEKKLQ